MFGMKEKQNGTQDNMIILAKSPYHAKIQYVNQNNSITVNCNE